MIDLNPSPSLHQLLDRHVPLVTRTVTGRTSAPWMTLEIKQTKVQRRLTEESLEEIRSSFDPDGPIPTDPVEFSGTVTAEFSLATKDFVKTVVKK